MHFTNLAITNILIKNLFSYNFKYNLFSYNFISVAIFNLHFNSFSIYKVRDESSFYLI